MKKHLVHLVSLLSFLHCFAAAPTVSSFSPASATTGMTVTITGTGFTGVTEVRFGNTAAASFTVVSPTQITAVLGGGASGSVQVINGEGSASLTGFNFVTTSRIITDFGGYWSSAMGNVNAVLPDSSHSLLAFTYKGTTYSTGANNSVLASQGISFFHSQFKALPVAGIAGVTSGGSTYLALARKVDGSPTVAYTPAVSHFSVKSVLVDGINGLDLGTGVTNLPTSAVLTFQVFNIDPTKVSDNEPDIILTQIADPSSGNDVFSFIDAAGNVVGNTVSQNMTALPSFGNYHLDLYHLSPTTPYNTATAYSPSATSTTRGLRLAAFRLSDFGITAANVGQVRALKLTPSGNSDYAFIGYNLNAFNLPPNISVNDAATTTAVCNGGTATLAVLGSAAAGGALSYTWEESTNGGTTWAPVSNGGRYSGAATNILSVANAVNGHRYRATVQEAGNPASSTSPVFTIAIVNGPAAPTVVTVSGPAAFCLNTPAQLTSSVTGGSNLFYQWESNASGSYQDIPGANWHTLEPVIEATGTTSYRLRVSSGKGCVPALTSSPVAVTVSGVSSTAGAAGCSNTSVTLSATATSGTLNWYASDLGGAPVATGHSFTTPALNSTTTYYVATDGCINALRVPVTATIYPPTAGGTITGGTLVTSTSNSATLHLQGHTGNVLKWQSSPDHFGSQITDIANTSDELVVNNLTQSTYYRAQVQSGTCNVVSSGMASIIVTTSLPIHSSSLKVSRQASSVLVQWKAAEQSGTKQFEVERSFDGHTFQPLATIAPTAANEGDYQWLDKQAVTGKVYYRIKETLLTGSIQYTGVASVTINETKPALSVYPNPVTDAQFTLSLGGVPAGTYVMQLVNSTGQVVSEERIVHNEAAALHRISLNHRVSRGLYKLVVRSEDGKKMRTSLMVL